MAALGRWGAVDPLADQYAGHSPYNYVLGNPNSFVDPDGRAALPALVAACPLCVRAGVGFVGGMVGEAAAQFIEGKPNITNLFIAGGAGAAAGIVGGWGSAQSAARVAVGRSTQRMAAASAAGRYTAQGVIGGLTAAALDEQPDYSVAIIGGLFGVGGEFLAGAVTSRVVEEGAGAIMSAWQRHAARLREAGRSAEDLAQATVALRAILSSASREIATDGGLGAIETTLSAAAEANGGN
jgi:uncharacterized protein RhaS with RHS repeats